VLQRVRNFVSMAVIACFRLLPRNVRKVLIAYGTPATGIRSVEFEGTLGTFLGAPEDRGVFLAFLLSGTWAPEIQEIVRRVFVQGSGTYLDVGANIGLTVVPAARRTGVACHAFEMEEQNFRYLRYNVDVNGVSANVTCHHCALYSEDTELEMELSEDNRGDHRLRVSGGMASDSYGESGRRTRQVSARRLDSILSRADLVSPVLLKIDVQGAEVDVLRGAGALLDAVDAVIIEFWPYGIAKLGHSTEQFFALLEGFRFGAVLRAGEPLPAMVPIGDILQVAREIPPDGSSTRHLDLFLARRSGR